MTITSLAFLLFCAASVLLFALFPPKYRWISLLLSSVAFYFISVSNKLILVWIVITSLSTWFAGRQLDKVGKQADAALKQEGLERADKQNIRKKAKSRKKKILVLALVLNVGILVVFKFFNYFTGAFQMLVGLVAGSEKADLITLVMPLGISYYTFATIGYMLDVYWKRYESEPNFARFFLFAIFYPHILQGPISRYNLLGQELKKPELHITWDNFVCGMESICLGCFKKLVIADRVSIFVGNTLTANHHHGMIYVVALIFDAIQIYTDFSGYMDIVTGISRIFDIKLEQNFNHPFLAKSVPEFWRRWHMSLGGWFKDYVYYPISMSKGVKKINKRVKDWKNVHLKNLMIVILPVMVTWLLTGLWHGTGKGYVAWGLYYGTLITLSVTFSDDIHKLQQKLHINTECFSFRVFQTLKIFCIFIGGRFLGSTIGMPQRIRIIKNILVAFVDFNIFSHGMSRGDFVIVLVGVLLLIAIAAIETKENIFDWFNRQNLVFRAIVLYAIIFAVFLLGIYGTGYDTSNFMYQQF